MSVPTLTGPIRWDGYDLCDEEGRVLLMIDASWPAYNTIVAAKARIERDAALVALWEPAIDAARAWRANRQAGAYDLAATSAAAHALLRALDQLDQQENHR